MFDYLHTPYYVDLLFVVTVLTTLYLLFVASHRSKVVLLVSLAWLLIQTLISITGFYADTLAVPPRFALIIGPPLLLLIYLFLSRNGKLFMDSFDLRMLTQLHVVRALVEIILWRLYIETYVPKLMTFEGRNFDILAGISAPIVAYFAFHKPPIKRTLLIVWNFICLGLVLNIVINAILSAPTPFQQFAFDQPNIGVLYFPYTLLPGFVVPVVLFSHLASIRQLLKAPSKT